MPQTSRTSHSRCSRVAPSSRISKKPRARMVATRSTTRKAAESKACSQKTFPELVRSRIAYSPSPSVASSSAVSHAVLAKPQARQQHLQWPSQLATGVHPSTGASSDNSAAAAAQSSSSTSSWSSPAPSEGRREGSVDLEAYAALLQGSMQKTREVTGSPSI